ncbi:MAG: hypothetical protein ACRDOI_47245 [Trebonia sp.]
MRTEDRVEDIDARLKRVTAEVQGLMQMPGIYGAEYGKIRTALEGHDQRFDRVDASLAGIEQELTGHRELLEQILAKVA